MPEHQQTLTDAAERLLAAAGPGAAQIAPLLTDLLELADGPGALPGSLRLISLKRSREAIDTCKTKHQDIMRRLGIKPVKVGRSSKLTLEQHTEIVRAAIEGRLADPVGASRPEALASADQSEGGEGEALSKSSRATLPEPAKAPRAPPKTMVTARRRRAVSAETASP